MSSPPTAKSAASDAETLFFTGSRHLVDGQTVAAEQCLRQAIGLLPYFAEAHANLGLLLDQSGRKRDAEWHYRRALALAPADGQTQLNFAVMLAGEKRFAEAAAAYRAALALLPESPVAWSNLGVLQACLKQEADAERSYRQAIALDPAYRTAPFNLAYLLLRQGRYAEGWRCLEARDWYAQLDRHLGCPRWRGESVQGKSVLIGIEAGHGDMIQLCRYATVLKARGAAKVSVLCHPALTTLLASADGVDCVVPVDAPLASGDWDLWTPPFSIPFYCQTRVDTIPADLPYLHAARDQCDAWAARLQRYEGGGGGDGGGDGGAGGERDAAVRPLRVGLVWKGNPAFENDADRSLASLDLLKPLGAVAGVRFFSLQKGAGEAQAAQPPHELPLVNLGPQLADFAATAALIENLDLLICVDTAVAHLAGALGKRCWLLLPDYKTDWRWLAERSDTPWYPGVMRLFRQPRMGDWESVVVDLCRELCQLVGARSAPAG